MSIGHLPQGSGHSEVSVVAMMMVRSKESYATTYVLDLDAVAWLNNKCTARVERPSQPKCQPLEAAQ